ncbi:MAG: YgiT-type zinc finger protein [Chloroflexota bacterium]
MDCFHRQGNLVLRKASYAATRHSYHLIIDDAPAWVCEQCLVTIQQETRFFPGRA